jgi:chromosome segregation ATPase
MIATHTTTQDLEASLRNCLAAQQDCQTELEHHQSVLNQLQNERAVFESKKQAREAEHAAFLPQLQEAQEKLKQAQDYADAASGSIKISARDEELAVQEAYNELRADLLTLTRRHQSEADADQPSIDALESKIRSERLAISQLEAKQTGLNQTRGRLHAELGQSLYAHLSAILSPARQECERLDKESDQAHSVYAQLRRESFPQLDPWPELKRKLQEENSVTDNSIEKALTLFATFCELMSEHPIADMSIVELFCIDSYNVADLHEGHSNSHLFDEKARLARDKIAELQYSKK